MFVGLVAAQGFANERIYRLFWAGESKAADERLDRKATLDPAVFRVFSFGNVATAADWLWLKVLVDPYTTSVPKDRHPALFYNLDLLTELDPAFSEAYTAGGNLLAVIRDDFTGARALLEKGNRFVTQDLARYPAAFRDRFWSDAWTVPVVLAYVHLFGLQDMHSAAQAFREAARLPRAPVYLTKLAERLEKSGGEYEVGLRLLHFMIGKEKDARVRSGLEKKRASLFLSQYLFELNRSFQTYLNGQPEYRASASTTPAQMQRYWRKFLKSNRTPLEDPFGGRISLDAKGRIVSSTPRVPVFGMD